VNYYRYSIESVIHSILPESVRTENNSAKTRCIAIANENLGPEVVEKNSQSAVNESRGNTTTHRGIKLPSSPMPVKSIPIEALMQHADSLYRFAISRVKDHHAAEDLVQECLSVAWQRIDTFDARSSLGTWLIGIMKFKVIDHFRRSKRTPTDQNIEPGDGDANPVDSLFDAHGSWKVNPNHGLEMLAKSPDQLATNHEALEWIRFCLGKLPERLRVLFNLREVDGLDVSSAASAAGVTPGSAAVLLTRSRQRLRICLQENGIQP